MKTKNIVKIILDIIMFVFIIILTFGFGVSQFFHEVFGIASFVLFAVHLILNKDLIKGIFKGKSSSKAKSFLVIDILLTICMMIILVTSLLISQVVFNFNINVNYSLMVQVHTVSSYVLLLLLGSHIGLHMSYIISAFSRVCKNISTKNVRCVAISTLVLAVLCTVIYTQAYSLYYSNESSPAISNQDIVKEQSTQSSSQVQTGTSQTKLETAPETSGGNVTDNTFESKDNQNVPTLEEYLGHLTCSGCNKGCPLSNPGCATGATQANSATQEYYNIYD